MVQFDSISVYCLQHFKERACYIFKEKLCFIHYPNTKCVMFSSYKNTYFDFKWHLYWDYKWKILLVNRLHPLARLRGVIWSSTSKKKISFDDGNRWSCKRGPKIPQNTECCHWSFSVVRIRCSNTWSKQCRFSAFNPVERRMVPLSNDLFLLHWETISMGMGKPLTSTFKKGTSSRLLRCFLIYGLRL